MSNQKLSNVASAWSKHALRVLLTCISLATCLLFFTSSTEATGKWVYSCQLLEHTDQNGKFKESSPYSHFICVTKSTATQQSSQYELLINDGPNIVWVFSQPPSSSQFQIIALTNPENEEYGAIETGTIDQITEENIEDAVSLFSSQALPSCGQELFSYGFKSPERKLWEAVDKEAKKQLKRFQPPKLNPKITKTLPIAKRIAASWPQLLKLWDSLKGYLAVAGAATQFLSASYSDAIRESVATYHPEPLYDFTGCLIQVLVDTNELLSDMYMEGVTADHFTSLNTIDEIRANFTRDKKTFKTTGRFINFDDQSPECRCPACPGSNTPEPNSFTDCLVDVEIQTDVFIIDALRLTNSDFNKNLTSESLLSGYFLSFNRTIPAPDMAVLSIEINDTMSTATVLHGKFLNFDAPFGSNTSKCSCQTCPQVQTEGSEIAGTILIGITNIAITCTLAVALLAIKHAALKIYRHSQY